MALALHGVLVVNAIRRNRMENKPNKHDNGEAHIDIINEMHVVRDIVIYSLIDHAWLYRCTSREYRQAYFN